MRELVAITFVIIALLSAGVVMAQEEEVAAPPEPLWTGSGALGYVSTSGNTDTQSLGVDFSLTRRPTPWGLEVTGLFTRSEDGNTLTAERLFAGLRGTRSLNDRWNVFAGLSGEKNEFAGFDLRTLLEAGATFKAIDDGTLFLSFDAGLTYTDEDRLAPAPDASFMGALAAAHFGWAFSETAKLTEDLSYYPNFDESSDWRLASVTALEASLNDLFGLRLSYEYNFRNEPIGNADDTDTTTRASLVVKF